jgi:hypothetical protein
VNEYRGGYADREHPRGFGGGVGAYHGYAYRPSYDPGEYDRRLYRHEDDVARRREDERRGARGYRERGPAYDHDRAENLRRWRFGKEARGYRERGPAFDSVRGPHGGKGPRGYRRSDEHIRVEVCERIVRAGWIDASDVEVDVRDGEVTLSGTVFGRDEKRAIQDLADEVGGVHDVHNRLRLHRR